MVIFWPGLSEHCGWATRILSHLNPCAKRAPSRSSALTTQILALFPTLKKGTTAAMRWSGKREARLTMTPLTPIRATLVASKVTAPIVSESFK